MQIDAAEIVKVIVGLGSAGAGFGGAFAFLKPFATELITMWLARIKRRAEIEDAKDGALERIAVSQERLVGVLESVEGRLDRLDARQDRVEAHLGIPLTASTVPAAPPAQEPKPGSRCPRVAYATIATR